MSIRNHKPYRWESELAEVQIPEDFLVGVCNSPYHAEGHYNGSGEPCNQWAEWERQGKVERSGLANDFWNRYDEHFDVAQRIGLNGFRIGFDWTRIQPTLSDTPGPAPPFEARAWDHYAEIVRALYRRKIEPVVTLYHFIQPAWAGTELWIDDDLIDRFIEFATRTIVEVNSRLARTGDPAIKYWITFNEPGIPPQCTYINGEHPHNPAKMGMEWALRAQDGIMSTHVRLYHAIHSAYREHRWRQPQVGYNTVANALYEHDKALSDLIRARERGVTRSGLERYLEKKRREHYAVYDGIATRRFEHDRSFADRYAALKKRTQERFNPLALTKSVEALYNAPSASTMDYVAINIYDPFLPLMTSTTGAEQGEEPAEAPKWWEWVHERATYTDHLKLFGEDLGGLPLYILEASIGHEQPKEAERGNPRPDRLTREQYLKESLGEVLRAIKNGIDVRAYFYWTLCDNYEWGTYTNRLGLLGYDFESMEISNTDGLGAENGRILHTLIDAMRSGEATQMNAAFGALEEER